MRRKLVIEVEAESYMEEQFLLDKFPDAKWLNLGGTTMFYISIEEKEEVLKAITEWKEHDQNAG